MDNFKGIFGDRAKKLHFLSPAMPLIYVIFSINCQYKKFYDTYDILVFTISNHLLLPIYHININRFGGL